MSAAEERLANDPSSELWGEHRSRYRFAAQFVTGQRVLDIACGAGFGLEVLGASGARAVGVDYDQTSLQAIRRERPRARLVRGDALDLPLRDNSVDVVVSFETLEHVPDARAMLVELRRVLKPGGQLVLSTPNKAFGPPERRTANSFHVREFTADELRDLLCECFEEVQLYGQRPTAGYQYVPFLMLERRLEPAALAWKAMLRLPLGVRDSLSYALSGRPFFPSETDYRFDADHTEGSHALLAIAQ